MNDFLLEDMARNKQQKITQSGANNQRPADGRRRNARLCAFRLPLPAFSSFDL